MFIIIAFTFVNIDEVYADATCPAFIPDATWAGPGYYCCITATTLPGIAIGTWFTPAGETCDAFMAGYGPASYIGGWHNTQDTIGITTGLCAGVNLLQGSIGKGIAILGVMSITFGAFFGKISWGLAISAVVAIGILFAAQPIMTFLSDAGSLSPC